ncbi:recombinase RecT [Bacillus sp. CRN 9]|nr:recombinase RecT [Bacillus sp. CRN 9]
MEKIIIFTNEQKSLIFNRFVAPANGNESEAFHFVEYCETMGLNPLIGDVIFQKFEGKYGPKTSFVTTRDGMLRVAARDENYVGPPISCVVREGDTFKVLPNEGSVTHEFGQKRGKILGAYAVLSHRVYSRYVCWIDFEEYFTANANSQKGKSYIWDNYPSSMIEKVAEAKALKHQFPIVNGLTTEEEIGEELSTDKKQVEQNVLSTVPQSTQITEEKKEQQPNIQNDQNPNPEQIISQPLNESNSEASEAGEEVTINSIEIGTSPSNVVYGKINIIKTNGQQQLILARGEEQVKLVEGLKKDQKVIMEIVEENGFHFVDGVKEIVS